MMQENLCLRRGLSNEAYIICKGDSHEPTTLSVEDNSAMWCLDAVGAFKRKLLPIQP